MGGYEDNRASLKKKFDDPERFRKEVRKGLFLTQKKTRKREKN